MQTATLDATEKCPVTQTLRVIAGRWKPVVLYHLMKDDRLRYSALRERLTGVTTKVLTQQLRELVADGVLDRTPAAGPAARVEYGLTERGRTLVPVIRAMIDWGNEHRAATKATPAIRVVRSQKTARVRRR